MLRKIISVRNVGRFRSSAGTPNPQLAKHTLVTGANGFGKTTLCAIMRSLQTGDPSHVIGRKTLGVADAPSIELLLPNGPVRFDAGQWSATLPAMAIFDGVFVAENVHSGEVVDIDQRRNLYRVIVGEAGVQLANRDSELAGQSRAKTGDVTAAERAVKPHTPTGMTTEAFLAIGLEPEIDRLIIEQEGLTAAAREAGAIRARAALTTYQTPSLPDGIIGLLSRTLDNVAEDAEQRLAAHLDRHGMADQGGPWIATGLHHAEESCPFCGQDIKGLPLIAAYRAVFSKRFEALAVEIDALRNQIAQAFGDRLLAAVETVAAQNRGNLEYWGRFCQFSDVTADPPARFTVAAENLRTATLSLLDRKAASPFSAVAADAAFLEAQAAYDATLVLVQESNRNIEEINRQISEKKASTDAANVQAAEIELAHRKAVRARHTPEVIALCSTYSDHVAEKARIDRLKDEVRAQLDSHTRDVVQPYERRINEHLGNFNAGFIIADTGHKFPGGVATSSYQIVINGVGVELGDGRTPTGQPSFKNTLSAGDRTTLALAFFLAHLERSPNAGQTIVVFDDPFNSQDAFRRRQTVHEIMCVARNCAQIIVLSHDATFLKQVWDKAPHDSRVALGITDHRTQGSKISEIDIERACQGRTASDIDDLQTFMSTGAGSLIDLIRKCRVVLETYCRSTYPASFDATDWLGDIVRKIREGGDQHSASALYAELDQINGYTSQYHHGEDLADATPDQLDASELTGFVRRSLRVANALQA